MPDPSPAAELRTAAATVREWSAAADADSPAPWYIRVHGRYHLMRYGTAPGSDLLRGGSFGTRGQPRYMHGPVGRWIALMGPDMGPLLADWLETTADLHEPHEPSHGSDIPTPGCQWCNDEDWPCADTRKALAVARAVNAKEQQ